MFRIDPRYIGVEEARRREELGREIDEAWRDWWEFKRSIEALQLETKWDGQPRDRGRYGFGKQPRLVSQPALLRTLPVRPLRAPVVPQAPKGVETALREYAAASNWNSSERRAVLRFNARAFEPGARADDVAPLVGVLTRDNVADVCPRYWEVQSITNQAGDLHSPGDYATKQERGTAIHRWVRDEINGLGPEPENPDFRSELSVIKSKAADYGEKGSIRVDAYENLRNGTVCIYDIKTGDAGLSFGRMQELASNVGKFYPLTNRIVVTEVRPYR